MLAHADLLRALRAGGPQLISAGRAVLGALDGVDVTREILEAAATIRTAARLRTLDAIHLATALAVGDGLLEMIVYDARLRAAAAELGLLTVAPNSRPRHASAAKAAAPRR
jgi:uncharacterized protein